ncbi:MAG: PKD domain-containing protein [Nanoarchaeota archaeon]|nr:PKD domain-containing protein [Nanoarchaeota archaeon]
MKGMIKRAMSNYYKYTFILAILFGLLCLNGVSAFNVYNVSLTTSYTPYGNLAGNINVSLAGENLNSVLSCNSDLVNNISLRDFLNKNNAVYNCTPSDCSDGYSAVGGEFTQKTFLMNKDEIKLFGFILNGKNIEITGFSFDVLSDFEKQVEVPLKLSFFNNKSFWEFNKVSDDYSGVVSYGCYDNNSVSKTTYVISSDREYCENISLPHSGGSMMLGADISGVDNKELKMFVYYNSTSSSVAYCTFNPSINNSCIANKTTGYDAGDYTICVKSSQPTNYQIYSENSGSNCGWFGLPSGNSTRDYSIFAKTAKYAPSEKISINRTLISSIVSDANSFIQSKYNKDCSEGCILPISATGVNQNLNISNINILYRTSEGDSLTSSVSDLTLIPAKISSFVGKLNLASAKINVFSIKGDRYISCYLNGQELFNKLITIIPAPVINSLTNLNPPAGISARFRADVSSDYLISKYIWDFGDGNKEETTTNSVNHVYNNITNYTLTLKVIDNKTQNSSRTFLINTISPKDYINSEIQNRKNDLISANNDINNYPTWYQQELRIILDVNSSSNSLKAIEDEISSALTDKDYLNIAIKLQKLNIPTSVVVSDVFNSPLIMNPENININSIKAITNDKNDYSGLESEYQNSILNWKEKNIANSIINIKKIVTLTSDNQKDIILNVYTISITSNANGYLIIELPLNEINFKISDSSLKSSENAVGIALFAGQTKNIEFAIEDNQTNIFISPGLDKLEINTPVSACNFNKQCDADETMDNCPSDCYVFYKDKKLQLYALLLFIFAIILYTIIQIWYTINYENNLFKDRRHLFNLLMYIDNARARGMSDYEIRESLRKNKWPAEKITYAIKKSRGKRTGMIEIIPISFISSLFRAKKNTKLNKA